jgi:hypothetical protein
MTEWRPVYVPNAPRGHIYPDRHNPIWLMRSGWEAPELRMWGELDPATNAIGLFWSPSEEGKGPPEFPSTPNVG